MLNYFIIELKKAFINKKMLIILCVACGISLSEIVTNVIPVMELNNTNTDIPISAFEKMFPMIGVEAPQFYIYIFTIIIFATIPYASTTYSELKKGVVKNIFIRTKRSHYYIAKYIVTFLSGGTIVVVPLLLNTLVTALLLPSIEPDAAMGFYGIDYQCMLVDLFYSNTYLYLILYMLIDFVVFGLLNTLSVTAVWVLNNEFAVLMLPFLVYTGSDLLSQATGYTEIALPTKMYPKQVFPVNGTEILIYIIALLMIAIVSCMALSRRKDVL
ncbi:hypothetical protein [Eubacterium sp. AF15-50]|uniref:hypothetical protein n=1 Tax=Eubacterium sp. AF15-50 TaxID=2293103 RepID=UPI0026724EEE|nr:hypothetical protein [Eubacterium sp. AF15-50]